MRKRFTRILAALALLLLALSPMWVMGQVAPVNTVLWAEDFSGYSSTAPNNVPSGEVTDSHSGTTVYGGVTLTYSVSNGGGTTKVYSDGGPTGGGGNNLLIAKGNGSFSISGISTGNASELTLSYAKGGKGTLSVSTTGATISGSTITPSGTTFSITFTNTSTGDNLRIDNIQIIVKTAGVSTTHTFITAVSPEGSGSVTAKDSGDNTVASGSEVGEEALLTVTAEANPGYKFTLWSFVGENSDVDEATDNPTTFMMGTEDATLTANFAVAYAVNISDGIENGSVVANMATATAGETVTITATPAVGYDFTSFTVTKASSGTVEVTTDGTEGVFEMPDEAVTVSATFTAKTTYTITTAVTPESSGTITTAANAWEGKTVNVSVSPAAGYVYKEIAITKTGDPGTTVSYTGNASDGFSFTMPAYAVTVTVTFRTAEIYALYSGTITEGDYVIYYSGKAIKNTVSSNRLDYIEVTPVSDQIVDPAASIVWHISQSGDYWKIYNANVEKYMASNGTDKQAALDTGNDTKSSWIVTGTSTYEFENVYKTNNYKYLRNNTTYGFACYQSSTGGALSLYKKTVNSTLAVASVANGTITATPAGGSEIAEGGSITVSSGTTVTLSASGEGGYVLDAWDVYKTEEPETKVTVTNNSFTMPDYGVTVSASFRQPTTFTVQYSVNGAVVDGLTQTDVAEGTSVTLPTSVQVTTPSGFSYVGWSESETSETVINGSTYTPADNTTLYLVFVKSGQTVGYNKVTNLSDITPGKYIIVNANYCLPSSTTTSSPVKSSVYSVSDASSTSTYTSIPANTEWIFTGTNSAMTIKNNEGSYLYSTNSNTGIRVSSTPDTWAFEICGGGFAMMESNNKYCATYKSGSDWRSYTSATHENYGDGGVLYLYKKTQAYTRVYNATTTTMASIPATSIITVPNGVTLTLTGANLGTEENLIIEDGGQLITSSAVQATIKKSINGWETTSWYFISSPISTAITPDGLITDDLGSTATQATATYDLYSLDVTQEKEWQNYRQHNFSLANGMGYLYASKVGTELSFSGTIQPSNENIEVTGLKDGFNLVGNPYTCTAYVNQPHYTLQQAADGITSTTAATSKNTAIAPLTGVIISGTTATFSKNVPATSTNNGNIQMTLAQTVATRSGNTTTTIDNVIVSFNEGSELEKFYFIEQNASLYIPQGNEEYAIVSSNGQGEMPVNFKAHRDGQYTITVNPQEVEMDYLHLIDNIAGKDVDLLANPSYTFNAKGDDYESRFRLVFSANMTNAEMGEDFAFFSNGQLVIANEGEAILQVIDVTGRVVATESINGTCSKAVNAKAGVYVLRLVNGTDVKTQKMVIR